MNLHYSEVFDFRAHRYHKAMQQYPRSREREFSNLFFRKPVLRGEYILDIPAGGGYLKQVLPDACQVEALELTAQFSPEIRVVEADGEWGVSGCDRAVCVAALHHIPNQCEFVDRLAACVRPGGQIHLADASHGGAVSLFLDGFVGLYNQTGHVGRYLESGSFDSLTSARVTVCEERACRWRFESEAGMLDFCEDLFGLVDCPPGALLDALENQIGVRRTGGGVVVDWRLLYFDMIVC